MNENTLLLLLFALLGAGTLPAMRRMAALTSELPLKHLLGTLAAAAVVIADLSSTPVAAAARPLAGLFALAWVGGPLLLPTLARARMWPLADGLVAALYWTPAGRDAARRLLAQTAVQMGDGAAALARLPSLQPEAIAASAHALQQDWHAVLRATDALSPARGGPVALALAARVQALIALENLPDANALVESMRAGFEQSARDPIAYRAWVLSQARIDAERGNLRRVQEALQNPPAGVPMDVWLAVLARAAEVAGDSALAVRIHTQAFTVAPPGRARVHAQALEAAGAPLPVPAARTRRPATLALVGVIGLAFVGQELLDGALALLTVGGLNVRPSSVAAAFVLALPGFPLIDAPWRYLSYAFVHGNLIHVGFNLWVLLDMGRMVEARRGPWYFLAAFTVGTAMGAYLSGVMQSGNPTILVGASGGVLGVAGALLADVSRSSSRADRHLMRGLLQWMLLIAFVSLAIPNVSWWGHLGGVLGGALWGFARAGLPASKRVDVIAGGMAALALAWALGQALRVAAVLL